MRRRFMIAAAVVCFLAAAMATVFPVLSNYYTEKHRSEIRTEYFQTVEALTPQSWKLHGKPRRNTTS